MLPNPDDCVVWACPNTGVAVAPPNRPPVVGVLLPNRDVPVDPKAGVVNPVVFFPKVCPNGLAVVPPLKPLAPKNILYYVLQDRLDK
jgi:hypothetical protein